MGKSEIDRLRPNQFSLRIGHKNMNSPINIFVPNTKEGEDEEDEAAKGNKILLPDDMVILDNQVAGHMNDGRNYSMLKYKGYILKPIIKKPCSDRESNFYEQLCTTHDSAIRDMREFTPSFHGTEVVQLGDKAVDCLILEDLTRGYKEPCIMDIKIGKRTWDPFASYDKILKEDEKYHDSKRDVGFSIPGFQVYKVSNGKLCKYGKEYGRNLNKETIVDALKTYLNAEVSFNRNLLVQLLVNLWKIQNWTRHQHSVRLYSSSILLIYDARRLRQTLESNGTIKTTSNPVRRKSSLYRPMSLAMLHDGDSVKTGFSGQLGEDGPIFDSPSSAHNCAPDVQPKNADKNKVSTLKRVHSFHNNFDKDLQSIKSNYVYMLDDLVSDGTSEVWATVKMIDFAHAYPSEGNTIDRNYLQGVESLVKILEGFLSETYSQN